MRRGLLVIVGGVAAVVAAFAAAGALRLRQLGAAVGTQASAEPDRSAPARAYVPRPASQAPDERTKQDDGCEPPVRVAPRDLAAKWPTMVGKRVSFVGRVERSLGFGEALVVADGARFVVLLAPSDVWTGTARRTYRVIGSATVHTYGPTRLPQLLLEREECGDGGQNTRPR
jgi:hypothetical protein